MKIAKIAGYVGAGFLASSCSLEKPATAKSLEYASKYLKGYEVVVAEERASKIYKYERSDCSNDIFYWDSLLAVNREKEYKNLGRKYIQDSINNVYYRKPFFSFPKGPKTNQTGQQIRDSLKKEVSNYYSGEEFLEKEKKAPARLVTTTGTTANYETCYYGEYAIKGAERKGFFDGIKEARDSLKNLNKKKD